MPRNTNPLAAPDPSSFTSASGYTDALEGAGWEKCGSGVAGEVFCKAGLTDVVKVSRGDTAYIAFVKYVETDPRVVFPSLRLVREEREWAVTIIEKLMDLDAAQIAEVENWYASWISSKCREELAPISLSIAAVDVFSLARSGGFNVDLQSKNIMVRDGEYVITDPLI